MVFKGKFAFLKRHWSSGRASDCGAVPENTLVANPHTGNTIKLREKKRKPHEQEKLGKNARTDWRKTQ